MMQYWVEVLGHFVFFYPMLMGHVWVIGGLYFRSQWESNKELRHDVAPVVEGYPAVSLLVPCHNEGDNIIETIHYLLEQDYPCFEVIAINDGSTDDTGRLLDELERQHDKLRVVHLSSNQGKAMALRMGAQVSNSEYLVCVDGDALLAPSAAAWLVKHLHESPRVGSVTGNPRIRNRSTLLGKLQVGEFSSMIGLIKRTQRIYGRIFTVSGVVCAFRKTALQEIDYWRTDMITEDIDVSWRLQMARWDIRFEPRALCWILTPETLRGLWCQRTRWAQGGAEAAKRYFFSVMRWRNRHMWPILLEYLVSLFWCYLVIAFMLSGLLAVGFNAPQTFQFSKLLSDWNLSILVLTCLLQFTASLFIDSRYEKNLLRIYFWIVWFPLAYWAIVVFSTVAGAPRALTRRKGKRATWVSPDRGVRAS